MSDTFVTPRQPAAVQTARHLWDSAGPSILAGANAQAPVAHTRHTPHSGSGCASDTAAAGSSFSTGGAGKARTCVSFEPGAGDDGSQYQPLLPGTGVHARVNAQECLPSARHSSIAAAAAAEVVVMAADAAGGWKGWKDRGDDQEGASLDDARWAGDSGPAGAREAGGAGGRSLGREAWEDSLDQIIGRVEVSPVKITHSLLYHLSTPVLHLSHVQSKRGHLVSLAQWLQT